MALNPKEHLMRVGGKQYLPVAARIILLREAHPDATITTDLKQHELGQYALFFATVSLQSGGHATGWGSETKADFGDYLEKAETKAIGRAIAALGFGTLYATELDMGDKVVDTPVEQRSTTSAAARAPIPPLPAANLATHGIQYEQAKGREQPTITSSVVYPRRPERALIPANGIPSEPPDPALLTAREALKAAARQQNWTSAGLVEAARVVWPHIQDATDIGTLAVPQLTLLTALVNGVAEVQRSGQGAVIVPIDVPDEPASLIDELAAAVK